MKSSDSRTNSKYKSPYGCRTNSHCVNLFVQSERVKHYPDFKFGFGWLFGGSILNNQSDVQLLYCSNGLHVAR